MTLIWIFKNTERALWTQSNRKYKLNNHEVRGDILRPPHGTNLRMILPCKQGRVSQSCLDLRYEIWIYVMRHFKGNKMNTFLLVHWTISTFFFPLNNCWKSAWYVKTQNLLCKSLSLSIDTYRKGWLITKTYLYNYDPLKPHFYIVKLGFTGVYIIFLISAQKHRLLVLVRTASPRRF